MKLSLFALQVFLPLPNAHRVQEGLVAAVRSMPDASDFETKNQGYRRVVGSLLSHVPSFQLGVWDYFEEHDRAVAEF